MLKLKEIINGTVGAFIFCTFVMVGFMQDDVREIKKQHEQLKGKNLLCKQVYKIQSKSNYVLECMGVLK